MNSHNSSDPTAPAPRLLPLEDFDEWLKKPTWTVEEATFLRFGLDPDSLRFGLTDDYLEEISEACAYALLAIRSGDLSATMTGRGDGPEDWSVEPLVYLEWSMAPVETVIDGEVVTAGSRISAPMPKPLLGNMRDTAKARKCSRCGEYQVADGREICEPCRVEQAR
jgi:hypothetical protein